MPKRRKTTAAVPDCALLKHGSEFRARQAFRRYRVAQLYLQGLTIRAIQEMLQRKHEIEVTYATVWSDVQHLRAEWLSRLAARASKVWDFAKYDDCRYQPESPDLGEPVLDDLSEDAPCES